ncbi:lysophospholipid acyltransferase family protein [Knoellia sp. 3-2P3]|uniref:lysophospholipid acyltransferase family protein n=1 Tax=unclassified Knoellia TaxID=2618719 RepID=UPI0023D99A4A|nr:lysophospholipid acyltransferase family protein [Knoellia sp. 3-2P3]MDF2093829.1 lysophospholipid acyltransferase family protein [Knoellia sp. 3-2P3]
MTAGEAGDLGGTVRQGSLSRAVMRHVVIGPPLRLATRMRVEGREHVPPTGPLIVASNHLSFIDSIVIALASGRQVHFLGKAEYFQGTGLRGAMVRWFHSTAGTIPVDRADARAAARSLELGEQVLRRGDAFGVYPEGTRSPDGRLHRGRTGVARMALSSGATLVPCAVIGTDRVQPPGSKGLRPAKVTVRFGPPVDVDALSQRHQKAALLRAITDTVMDAIGEMSGQERSGRYASDVKAELAAREPSSA